MYWKIDSFWALKCLSLFGIAAYLYYILQPSDICFSFRHSSNLESHIKNKEFTLVSSKNYTIEEKYCIIIDILQHQFCPDLHLTTSPDELCLEQSREISAILSQLLITIFTDLCHMLVLSRGIQFLSPTQLAIPVAQVSMISSVCIILTAQQFRWPSLWKRARYYESVIPSNIHEFWLIWAGYIIVFMKIVEAIILYRAFQRNKNGIPKIIIPTSDENDNE